MVIMRLEYQLMLVATDRSTSSPGNDEQRCTHEFRHGGKPGYVYMMNESLTVVVMNSLGLVGGARQHRHK